MNKTLISLACFLFLIALTLLPLMEVDPEVVQPGDWVVTYEAPRSPTWQHVRGQFVREHPRCEACGTDKNLNVHHIKPFHTNPELELDTSNLITLCRDHHFKIGHLSNWSKSNPNVVKDARTERTKYK